MKASHFLELAVAAGFKRALVVDFLEAIGNGQWSEITEPTLGWLAEYEKDCDSEYCSQVRWDAKQRSEFFLSAYDRGLKGV